jgi:hypothetical protein
MSFSAVAEPTTGVVSTTLTNTSNATDENVAQGSSNTPAVPANVEVPTLPVGLNVNRRNVLPSIIVRGRENGENAVDFDSWLVPFDEVIQALGLKLEGRADGTVEIISPLFKFPISADKLVRDPRLGRAIAIRDLNTIPGLKATFNINKYAIDIAAPWLDSSGGSGVIDMPLILDGLPTVRPNGAGVSAIQQRVNIFGQNSNLATTQGEFRAIGSIFDGSWYLRLDQQDFTRLNTWNITDSVFIQQRNRADVVIGSQAPFWRRQNGLISGTYWGGTVVMREGFIPPNQVLGGDFLINERLQSARVGRSIVGRALPGTLVQLIRGSQRLPIREILVDSSGVYRFDNIPVGTGADSGFGQDYRVLLYPSGALTANPEVILPQFTSTPGQLPTGASAWVISAGGNRVTSGLFGDFDAIQGGVLYRRGIDESLTLGVGTAYDRELRAVGEIFWQPNNIPLQVAFSATTGSEWDTLGRLDYRPSGDFSFTANTDRFSTRSNASWRLSPSFTAISNYDSNRGTTIGGQYTASPNRYNATFVSAEIDNQARLRFSANQRLYQWQLSHVSNETATVSQISYTLGNLNNPDNGNAIVATYQTNGQNFATSTNSSSYFASLVWRASSPYRSSDGRYLWQTDLGYGFNDTGSGLVAGVNLNFIPGLSLRGSYRGVSENARDSYAIELTTTLLTTGGIQGGDSRIDELRTLGKVRLMAFYDNNGNGTQDAGEDSYYDPLLFKINQRQLKFFRVDTSNDSATVKLPPDSYRIDVDPAGYPLNYRSSIDAMRVDVTAGNVTVVSVPLVKAYIYTGTVVDTQGKPLPGARVEATSVKTGKKTISITNDAGVYILEGLEQGEYILQVSDLPTNPNKISITTASPSTQELNLTVTLPNATVFPNPPRTLQDTRIPPTPSPSPSNSSSTSGLLFPLGKSKIDRPHTVKPNTLSSFGNLAFWPKSPFPKLQPDLLNFEGGNLHCLKIK